MRQPKLLNIKKMKKLKLKALSLGAREILTRQQLQGVNGGLDSSGSDECAEPNVWCYCNHELVGCTDVQYCLNVTC
jgi:hypothetical protein